MKRSLAGMSAALVAAMALLSGCATSFVVDNNVQSFSSLPAVPAQPTYRFERLPSQQATAQDQLEALADAALHKAGLRRDDASPRYSVQVTARLQPVISPWASPWDGWGGFGYGWGHGHGRWRYGGGLGYGASWSGMESPWYHREAALVLRELASNKVVFESQATSDGPWSSNGAVFPAMFEAALQGFPNPPPGPRVVNIQVVPPPDPPKP
ncbi:MAG TPA: DUF4136 domain-containing protein [Ramlibacter sp.]|nr:DUF4136 domain-containing protein [Ramlibacter sp.]